MDLQKEWLEAFDVTKKMRLKKDSLPPPVFNESNGDSYDNAFNRKFL
jgi:hypothetical protein